MLLTAYPKNSTTMAVLPRSVISDLDAVVVMVAGASAGARRERGGRCGGGNVSQRFLPSAKCF